MTKGKKTETLTSEERLQAALVPESERPYPVPENWCWTRIGSILRLQAGKNISASKISKNRSQEANFPCFGGNGVRGYVARYNHDGEFPIIGRQGALCGNVNWASGKFYATEHAVVVECSSNISKRWAYHILSSMNLNQYATATAQPGLSVAVINQVPIALPPAPEQQRIVERIESLFVKLDEAKQKAQDALDSFETRKAAILYKAFTGELTAQWRKEHGVGMESWDRLQWGSFITSIEAGKNWNAEGRPPRGDEFGVVKVSAVTWGEFNELESKTCTVEEQWNENVQIHEGDFLFSRANTLQLVGNCVIIKSISRHLMLSDKILRFKFDKRVIPEYVLYFTRSNLYRNQIEQLASGNQDGMRNVSQKNMKLVEFPLPKLEEQKEIVRILGDLLVKEQQAKEAAEGVLEQIDLIKKTVLARAFRGELGTNDPSEESALSLLKKIIFSAPPKGNISRNKQTTEAQIPAGIQKRLATSVQEKVYRYVLDNPHCTVEQVTAIGKKVLEVVQALRELEEKSLIIRNPKDDTLTAEV